MPQTNYLKIRVGNRDVQVEQSAELPITLNYALEDPDNFEQKQGSSAFDLTIPATQDNSQSFNSPHNPGVEDLTASEFFVSHMPCRIEANGIEILTGKAFLKEATHTDRPEKIVINCYGDNSDWVIDLKEATLYDFLNPATHVFNATNIQNSWNYSGLVESSDFVYAPVRYRQPFQTQGAITDVVVTPQDLKPAISVYWIVYRAFKSLGYRLNSQFLDSVYFRRQVMPWTWGSFLFFSDGVAFPYMFKAMCTQGETSLGVTNGYHQDVSPNSGLTPAQPLKWTGNDAAHGGFENTPGLFKGPGMTLFPSKSDLNYYYPTSSILGTVAMGFELSVYYFFGVPAGSSNTIDFTVQWYVFKASTGITTMISQDLLHRFTGNTPHEGIATGVKELVLSPGDIVTARMRIDTSLTGTGNWTVGMQYPGTSSFAPSYLRNTYVKITLGSVINFKQYVVLKNYKFLDMLRGLIDFYNLSMTTDTTEKVVTIEPTHDYITQTSVRPGYFKSERVLWTDKQDLSQESTVELYADNEREFDFKFKEDGNDGGLQIINKRFNFKAGDSRYLFPERFKSGIKEYTNRFFSPVVHVFMAKWGGVTSDGSPQLIALIPENISETSTTSETESVFQPKLAYYKGNVTGAGGWLWQPDPITPGAVSNMTSLPFLFAVNYRTGGEQDPILTYSDQSFPAVTGTTNLIGLGLLRRFFLQRLAIMRHGKRYTTWMRFNLKDIANRPHREGIIVGNSIYYLYAIDGYKPLTDESTKVTLWKYHPVMQVDGDSCFPSQTSVTTGTPTTSTFDMKYSRALILISDLPA
jgi:hypothetical protein